MRKKLFLGALVLSAAAMLCGFDNTKTADEVMQAAQEATMNATDMCMQMELNADIAINMSGSTLGITADGLIGCVSVMDPLALGMEGTVNINALGQAQSQTLKQYMVTGEDGTMTTYTYTETPEGGAWTATTVPGINMAELMSKADMSKLSDFGLSFELAPDAVDINGAECYALGTTITSDTIGSVLAKVGELSGQEVPEDLTSQLALLNGIQLNVYEFVDAETMLPAAVSLDLNGSDFSIISQLLAAQLGGGEEASDVSLDINDLSFTCYAQYNTGMTVEVPDEALAAAN